MNVVSVGKKILNQVRSRINQKHDNYLRQITGVIHVGANSGQEREVYDKHGLHVIWVEPIPEVFEKLKTNIEGLSKQRAFQYLVTDRDGGDYDFHVANNNGASSSILDLKYHREVWPNIDYVGILALKSVTLASLCEKEMIDLSQCQALIMDTQGSELMVLKGGISLLPFFKYIKTEVPDFEAYAGCCQLADISSFMEEQGYEEYSRHKFVSRPNGGNYYDVVYRRKIWPSEQPYGKL
ncbi:MAG: FkbM family methyltransferase [Chloroflexi bacterium]|nr:FkbM family methyltransferase [Chloroflexota bacterium]